MTTSEARVPAGEGGTRSFAGNRHVWAAFLRKGFSVSFTS